MTSASREPRLPVVVVFLLGLWGRDLYDSVRLAGLKGNKGNQQDEVRADIDLGTYTKVVICAGLLRQLTQ